MLYRYVNIGKNIYQNVLVPDCSSDKLSKSVYLILLPRVYSFTNGYLKVKEEISPGIEVESTQMNLLSFS